jgi:hypothetical protein
MDETTQSEVEKISQKYEDNVKEQARKWEETKQNAENFRRGI